MTRRSDPGTGQIGAPGWSQLLQQALSAEQVDRIRRTTMAGRPCRSKDFVTRLEKELERSLQPQISGRKPKVSTESDPPMTYSRSFKGPVPLFSTDS
jgi:hypothetical protein